MKIDAKCDNCGRTFLLSQIGDESESPARCPFCGVHFGRHYLPVLIETVKAAEVAADNFIRVLARLEEMDTGFEIDVDGLLRRVVEQIRMYSDQKAAS